MGSQADKAHFTAFYKIGGKFTKKMGKEMEGHKKKEKPEWRPFRTFPTP